MSIVADSAASSRAPPPPREEASPSRDVSHDCLALDEAQAVDLEEGELTEGQDVAVPERGELPVARQCDLVPLDVARRHHPPGLLGESPTGEVG